MKTTHTSFEMAKGIDVNEQVRMLEVLVLMSGVPVRWFRYAGHNGSQAMIEIDAGTHDRIGRIDDYILMTYGCPHEEIMQQFETMTVAELMRLRFRR